MRYWGILFILVLICGCGKPLEQNEPQDLRQQTSIYGRVTEYDDQLRGNDSFYIYIETEFVNGEKLSGAYFFGTAKPCDGTNFPNIKIGNNYSFLFEKKNPRDYDWILLNYSENFTEYHLTGNYWAKGGYVYE